MPIANLSSKLWRLFLRRVFTGKVHYMFTIWFSFLRIVYWQGLLYVFDNKIDLLNNHSCQFSGYYCVLEANTNTPVDGVTGDVCPVGHYCPEMSSDIVPCPTGTYVNSTQRVEEADCLDCPLGDYCPGVGRDIPAGICDRGYYCPGRQNTSTPAEYRYTMSFHYPGSCTV